MYIVRNIYAHTHSELFCKYRVMEIALKRQTYNIQYNKYYVMLSIYSISKNCSLFHTFISQKSCQKKYVNVNARERESIGTFLVTLGYK